MRIACLFDIHGNITALEAVIADLEKLSPDLVIQGGDLADMGSSPDAVVDRIRSLNWPGVMGNTDQMLVAPESLKAFASTSKAPVSMWDKIAEIGEYTRSLLGSDRLEWLRGFPLTMSVENLIVVHASPADCWRAPGPQATDEELLRVYGELGHETLAYGHIHQPLVRNLNGLPNTVVNAGSVGLSYDGDTRAGYLFLENGRPTIRRVAYDIDWEVDLLSKSGSPSAEWTARMLRSGTPQMP